MRSNQGRVRISKVKERKRTVEAVKGKVGGGTQSVT